jgi:photosystem II stability/assembly factor-like uncharacterized protein
MYWSAIASSADGTKLAAAVQGGNSIDTSGHLTTWPGFIYTSTNSGATWKQTSAPSAPAIAWFSIASSADGTKLAAVIAGGLIYTSTNSGVTWKPTSAPRSYWTTIASSADGSKLVAGADADAPIYTSVDSGHTWIPQSVLGFNYWFATAASADGNVLLAATFSGGVAVSRSVPHPALDLAAHSGNTVLSWTVPSAKFFLQYSPVCGVGWTDVTAPPQMNLTSLNYELVVSPTNLAGFYRLENR